MVHKIISFCFLVFALNTGSIAQSELDNLLEDELNKKEISTVLATFKATRIIQSHSTKLIAKGELDFRVSHRFGRINSGVYDFFGLDNSTTHLALEYGITDWLMTGIGRSTLNKTVNGFVKIIFIKQKSGIKKFPFTIGYLSNISVNTLKWQYPDRNNYFSSRLSYVHQLMVARKINKKLSIQIMPVLAHQNLVKKIADPNDVLGLGYGGRYKFTTRFAFTWDVYYLLQLNKFINNTYHQPLALGFDIETGGHVFQLYVSNSIGMIDDHFLLHTTDDFFKGNLHIGFNISRVFNVLN